MDVLNGSGTGGNGLCLAHLTVLELAPPEALPADTPRYTTRVYLACAHLDHDPGNNAPSNLKALCQRCHILHDREEHLRQRWLTYRLRKARGDLFLGPYTAQTRPDWMMSVRSYY